VGPGGLTALTYSTLLLRETHEQPAVDRDEAGGDD
jgi:hypothetical protein